MWTFLIIVSVLFFIAIMWLSYSCDNYSLILVAILVIIIIAFAFLYCQSNALVADAEQYDFNFNGNSKTIYFDAEAERYFTLHSNDFNPLAIFRKEYLNTEQVEYFFSVYEEYEKLGDELSEIDMFTTK